MNELNMEIAATMGSPSDLRVLTDDELDDVNGGLFPLIIGVLGMSFFAGAFFGTMTARLIKAL